MPFEFIFQYNKAMLTAPETQEVQMVDQTEQKMQTDIAQTLGVPKPDVIPTLDQDPLKGESLLEGLNDAMTRNQGGEGVERSSSFKDIFLGRLRRMAAIIPGAQVVTKEGNK